MALNIDQDKIKEIAKTATEKGSELAEKAKEVAQNAADSELGQTAKKKAEQAKSEIEKEWNTVDDAPNSKPDKFYKKAWFAILMLIVFFPVGLFLMWKYRMFGSGKIRIIITAIFAIYILANMFNGGGVSTVVSPAVGTVATSNDLNGKMIREVKSHVSGLKYSKWDSSLGLDKQTITLGVLTKDNFKDQQNEAKKYVSLILLKKITAK